MKILYLYADDVYFWRNRLDLACEAKAQGFDVVLMAPLSGYRSAIQKEGIRVIPWNVSRRSVNPLRELRSLLEVARTYRRERPDIVQHEALKAVVHGGMAGRLTGQIPSVSVICGLGAIFTRSDRKMKVLRSAVLRVLSFAFRGKKSRAMFLNSDNRNAFLKSKTVKPEQVEVVPGPGIRIDRFIPQPEPPGAPLVLLPARMLWEKGVGEFVAAAKELRDKGVGARFVLAGAPDPDNPGCISEEQLRAWERSGVVEWWGPRSDMAAVYAQSTLVCLPSYAEGLPNVLAEAGACARAVVTTDVPGCRQAVAHAVNGLLVPARDAKALGAAIERLLDDAELRKRLGAMGRERAVKEFSHEVIVSQMLGIYRELLEGKWPTSESKTRSGSEIIHGRPVLPDEAKAEAVSS
jgi:glycosyltransferase involved in cell wall biosynthesis